MRLHLMKFGTLALMFLALVSLGWAEDVQLSNTGIAPAATGTIHIDNDRNGNTEIKLTVEHIAAPQALSPARQYYVVWIEPRGQQPELAGRLRVNRDDLAASIETLTPYDNFQVFITAENSEIPTMPSSTVLLRGTVQRR
jgi:hypothetical protein